MFWKKYFNVLDVCIDIIIRNIQVKKMTEIGMIDITDKPFVQRKAEAEGIIKLDPSTINLIKNRRIEKGDVINTAKIAAIQAVKKTPDILPLCHPIKITSMNFSHIIEFDKLIISVTVKGLEQTGVEMEALTGVAAGLLTVWDMTKQYEKDETGNYPNTAINSIQVKYKIKQKK